MKIVFFTQEDPFYVKIFFDEFLSKYSRLDEIKAVVISKPMGHKSLLDLSKQMYGLYGPFNFLKIGIKYVFYKLMSKKRIFKKAKNLPKTYSVKQSVQAYDIPVVERSDLNTSSFLDFIKSYNADLFISIASPIIFKKDLIQTPNVDCINIHNAPLPKYRGMLPNFWQLYHNEKESGITVHKIEEGIDTGRIISQIFLPIDAYESLHDLIIKTKKENANIIIDVIERYREGNVKYKNISGPGSYFTFPTRKNVIEFRKKGKKLF